LLRPDSPSREGTCRRRPEPSSSRWQGACKREWRVRAWSFPGARIQDNDFTSDGALFGTNPTKVSRIETKKAREEDSDGTHDQLESRLQSCSEGVPDDVRVLVEIIEASEELVQRGTGLNEVDEEVLRTGEKDVVEVRNDKLCGFGGSGLARKAKERCVEQVRV
jgi:hypothetical protein